MSFGRNLVLAIALVTLLGGVACKKRKAAIPPQSQPPTIEQPTIPPVASQPLPTPPTVTPAETKTESPAPIPTKTKIRRRKKPIPAPATTAKQAPPTKPPETSQPDPNVQIQADVGLGAASQRRQQTEGLLQAAEGNLKRISRSLTDGEESMQRQVRNFITQSRLAMQDGDLERAYNLATKAQLLSQELVK